MKKFELGVSSCGVQDLTEKDFESYANAGISAMELSLGYDRYDSIKWKEVYDRAKRYNIELWSFHQPFMPFEVLDLASLDENVRKHTVKYLSELMKKAADIGISVNIVHPSAEPNKENERGEKIKRAQESLAYLADAAEKCGSVIAVENLPRTCLGRDSKDIRELLSADDRLRACFDTNHLLKQPIKDFILDIGEKIITTHVSDFDFVDEKHWLPGEGKIDWNELIAALNDVKYTGPFMYELSLAPPRTIKRRMLTHADFKENYNSLMKGEKPKIIGTPLV